MKAAVTDEVGRQARRVQCLPGPVLTDVPPLAVVVVVPEPTVPVQVSDFPVVYPLVGPRLGPSESRSAEYHRKQSYGKNNGYPTMSRQMLFHGPVPLVVCACCLEKS